MTGPIDSVLSRLVDAKKTPHGWQARCPAHDDRGPSLSIATGEEGRVLLRCFAGCDIDAIARAIGLAVRDLFGDEAARRRAAAEAAAQRRRFDLAPRETLREFIVRESERARAARASSPPAYDTPHLRAADVNAARARANLVFGVTLSPIARFPWEGYDPHDRDPAWPTLFNRALEMCAWELHHRLNPSASAWETCSDSPALHVEAADRAAVWLRAMSADSVSARSAA